MCPTLAQCGSPSWISSSICVLIGSNLKLNSHLCIVGYGIICTWAYGVWELDCIQHRTLRYREGKNNLDSYVPHTKSRSKALHCRFSSSYQSRLTTLINVFLFSGSRALCSYEHFAPLLLPLASSPEGQGCSGNEKAMSRGAHPQLGLRHGSCKVLGGLCCRSSDQAP